MKGLQGVIVCTVPVNQIKGPALPTTEQGKEQGKVAGDPLSDQF